MASISASPTETLSWSPGQASLESGRKTMRPSRTAKSGVWTSTEVGDAQIAAFAEADEVGDKTWSRQLVERYLKHFNWYYPKKKRPGGPSLEKAWAYYEHVTLPRRIVGDRSTKYMFRRAEQGDMTDTKLYHPLRTPQAALSEWGIGIDLYFSTLRYLVLIFLFAGFLNIRNIQYYASPSYSGKNGQDGLPLTLRGSAVCTRLEWVVCSNCHKDHFNLMEDRDRFATLGDTVLVQRSACEGAQMEQGMVNWASLIWVIGCISLLSLYLKARGTRFDEDKVTCTDYSVVVRNPPPDAFDLDEWKDFFSQFADKQVTACTVTLNNEMLLQKLIDRRILRKQLRMMLPEGINLDDNELVQNTIAKLKIAEKVEPQKWFPKQISSNVMPMLRKFGLFPTPEMVLSSISELTNQVKELQKKHYDVTEVYVTFETEEGQRAALSALSVGYLDLINNNTSSLAPSSVFQGRVLKVGEPPEPSAVRWLDLSTSQIKKRLMKGINLALTLGILGFAGYLVNYARQEVGTELSGPLVTVFNTIIPVVVNLLMTMERHSSEGDYQTSLYVKITLFRWVNTALLLRLTTPFRRTLGDSELDVLPAVNAILFSELYLAPILRLIDIGSNFQKHVLAPRAKSQEEMNLNFQGTAYNMGERYTDLTKVLFLCFFYSSLQPLVFFYGAVIFFIQYYVDKYCLMRIWSWAPAIGPELSVYSRRYFFSGAILAFAIVSSYTYAQFPYDNLAVPDSDPKSGVAGYYPGAVTLNGKTIDINVAQDVAVVHCSQRWSDMKGLGFPAVPWVQPSGLRWMTDSQETLTTIYGWTSAVVLVVVFATFFASSVYDFFVSFFRGTYKPTGVSQKIDFSNVTEISGYVPQIKVGGFPFPFIACNIDEVEEDMMGWIDPKHNYDYHNLIFDVPFSGMPRKHGESKTAPEHESDKHSSSGTDTGEAVSQQRIFAVMKHWPPAWKREDILSHCVASNPAQVDDAGLFTSPSETIMQPRPMQRSRSDNLRKRQTATRSKSLDR